VNKGRGNRWFSQLFLLLNGDINIFCIYNLLVSNSGLDSMAKDEVKKGFQTNLDGIKNLPIMMNGLESWDVLLIQDVIKLIPKGK